MGGAVGPMPPREGPVSWGTPGARAGESWWGREPDVDWTRRAGLDTRCAPFGRGRARPSATLALAPDVYG